MTNRINTVVWDADNTLWDWIAMHLAGMEAMSGKIASITGASEEDVRMSMAKVYAQAGTFDYKALVQEMDLVEQWASKIKSEREKIKKLIDMAFAVHAAYTYSKHETFAMYPHTAEVLMELKNNGVENLILSDAPISKIIRRLKYFDIEKYFTKIFGREDAKADEEKDGRGNLENYENTLKERGVYNTNIEVHVLNGQKKPDVNLPGLLGKEPDEVSDHVAMIGDSFDKDMGTAHNNNCYGLYAHYGATNEQSSRGLYAFAPPNVVTRNAAGIDFSKDKLLMIQQMGDKLKVIDDIRDVLQIILGKK